MSQNTENLECAIIPKGTQVSIMGCCVILLEDTMVNSTQKNINCILKAQEDYKKGIGITSETK